MVKSKRERKGKIEYERKQGKNIKRELWHMHNVCHNTSPRLRKTLFLPFVLSIFTWIYPICPLLTEKQEHDLSHFYFTSLRRVLYYLNYSENFFAFDKEPLFDKLHIFMGYLISIPVSFL
jgi:hypothetical protein